MALYYFDLKNGTTERDRTGLDLDSDAAAIARARAMADEVSKRSAADKGQGHERHVCVIHEDGHEVIRIRVEKPAGGASAPRLEKFS
jgi:hypothetical protein